MYTKRMTDYGQINDRLRALWIGAFSEIVEDVAEVHGSRLCASAD